MVNPYRAHFGCGAGEYENVLHGSGIGALHSFSEGDGHGVGWDYADLTGNGGDGHHHYYRYPNGNGEAPKIKGAYKW